MAGALASGKLETFLEPGHHDRRPVQRFGHLGEVVDGVHRRQPRALEGTAFLHSAFFLLHSLRGGLDVALGGQGSGRHVRRHYRCAAHGNQPRLAAAFQICSSPMNSASRDQIIEAWTRLCDLDDTESDALVKKFPFSVQAQSLKLIHS